MQESIERYHISTDRAAGQLCAAPALVTRCQEVQEEGGIWPEGK